MSSRDLQSRADRLAASLDESFPEAWKPVDGEQIVGVFRRLERSWDRTRNEEVGVAIFDEVTSGRPFAVWMFHQALRTELGKARPAAGDLVAIRRIGRVLPKGGGNPYVNYQVRVERARVTGADWDAIGSNGDAPPEPAEPDDAQQPTTAPDVCAHCGAYLEVQPHEVWCQGV